MIGLVLTLTSLMALTRAQIMMSEPALHKVIFLPSTHQSVPGYREDIASEFSDVFSTGRREWRLAFRGTSGINKPVFQAYTTPQTEYIEPGCKEVLADEPCENHYRNEDVFSNWHDIDEVALVVYKHGRRVAHVTFDGQNTDTLNWMTEARLRSSSWPDLKRSCVTKNYFSAPGDAGRKRHFFLSKSYAGCPEDLGWFVAVDLRESPCTWETKAPFPLFLYSKTSKAVNWTDGKVGIGDIMAIYVKYRNARYGGWW